jgi:hypothetical protein
MTPHKSRTNPFVLTFVLPPSHSSSVSLSSKHISSYVNRLLTTTRSTEHRTIENFILCTKEAEEADYKTVQRNVRQFVDGMRNFIITQHGAGFCFRFAPVKEPRALPAFSPPFEAGLPHLNSCPAPFTGPKLARMMPRQASSPLPDGMRGPAKLWQPTRKLDVAVKMVAL